MKAGSEQPLFHVEHAVDGTDEQPLNRWRIVHLTDDPKPALRDRFDRMDENPWLPEYVEIYLRDDLNVNLSRRNMTG